MPRGECLLVGEVIYLSHLQIMVLTYFEPVLFFLQVLLLWLSSRSATLHELLEAVESTSAAAGSLQQLIEMARSDGQH